MLQSNKLLISIVIGNFILILLLGLFYYNNKTLSIPSFSKNKNTNNSSIEPQKENRVYTQVITVNNPLTLNATNAWATAPIEKKVVKALGEMIININLSLSFPDNSSANASGGFVAGNGLADGDTNARNFYLTYHNGHKQWVLVTTIGKKQDFYVLLPSEKSKLNEKFKITIDSTGKTLVIASPAGFKKTITLASSLYEISNNIKFVVRTAPNSKLDVTSFSYSSLVDENKK
jgi:uncharacterized protein Veg